MGELEILHDLVQLFEKFHLPYLLTGGYAVTYYGEPRATNDIDFLVEITENNKKSLLQVLSHLNSRYIFDKRYVDSIQEEETEFTVVHANTGIKIDFWVVPKKDFEKEYQRRQTHKVVGKKISLVSPEDLILTKLRWCKEVFSERHFTDCQGIMRIQKGNLDINYLKTEAKKIEAADLLSDINPN